MSADSARRDGDVRIPDTASIRLREGSVVWRVLEGEVVALDLDRSSYLNLNETGSALWRRIADGATRRELVDELLAGFEVEAEQAESDVDAFLLACRARNLLDA